MWFFSAFNTVTLYYLFKSRNKQEVFPFYFKTHFLIGLNTGKKIKWAPQDVSMNFLSFSRTGVLPPHKEMLPT